MTHAFFHVTLHVMRHMINSGSATLLKDNSHYGLNTWDSPTFGFRTEEVWWMRGEMSLRNVNKSCDFLLKSLRLRHPGQLKQHTDVSLHEPSDELVQVFCHMSAGIMCSVKLMQKRKCPLCKWKLGTQIKKHHHNLQSENCLRWMFIIWHGNKKHLQD